MVGALSGSGYAVLEFVIQWEGEAKFNHTHILDFKKANFCKFREFWAEISWTEALKERGVQDGGDFF